MMKPASGSTRKVQTADVANRRKASELIRIAVQAHAVTESAHRLDNVRWDLLAKTPDEHFYRIGIAIEILIVQVFDEFRPRDDATVVMDEVGEQPVLVARQLDGLAVAGDARGFGVQADRTALDLRFGVSGGAADLGTDAGQQL